MNTVSYKLPRTKTLLVVGLSLLFVFSSVLLMADGGAVEVLVGFVGVVFFGGGGLLLGVKALRVSTIFELTPQGLSVTGGGVVPWADVEDAGIGRPQTGVKVVGVRLSDYTAFLESTPESAQRRMRAVAWGASGLGLLLLPSQMNQRTLQRPSPRTESQGWPTGICSASPNGTWVSRWSGRAG